MRSQEAAKLIEQGYCRISNKHKLASRIDKANWKEILAAHLRRSIAELYISSSDPKTNLPIVGDEVAGIWCDYYRRCLSKDIVEVSPDIFEQLPSSDHNPIGYRTES